ncbi:Dynactin subunit p22 [Teratosphaeria destructans]|uniref:Dynactin subunit p22 n=1 Tax=Teratosphaeria destructans TaxID=418781 RepID=A0A9W7W166_9PEZI|nr:Dynactin subunit p22 [Teratosphaeria destructans]
MGSTSKETATDTLALLEDRVRRIHYALTGSISSISTDDTPDNASSATARLRHLERSLASLAAQSPTVAEVLALQKSHPSLFNPASPAGPNDIPPQQLVQLILSHAPTYTSLASQLTQLSSNPSVPDTVRFVQVVPLQDRIQKARAREAELQQEVAMLRQRSAKVVKMWYERGVLEMGGKWADWEERCREAEKVLTREEARKGRDEGVV